MFNPLSINNSLNNDTAPPTTPHVFIHPNPLSITTFPNNTPCFYTYKSSQSSVRPQLRHVLRACFIQRIKNCFQLIDFPRPSCYNKTV